jgi:hypothetical protein
MNVNDPIPSIHDWEAYSNHPVIKAKRAEDAARYKAYREEEAKRLNEYFDALKKDNKQINYRSQEDIAEYNKLFNADKQRFLNQGLSEELAHSSACFLAQARENSKLGYSND